MHFTDVLWPNELSFIAEVSWLEEIICDSKSKMGNGCSVVSGFIFEVDAVCVNSANGDNVCIGELDLSCAVSDRGNNCKFIQGDDGRVWIVNISNGSSSSVCSLKFIAALLGLILFGLNDWRSLGIEEVDPTDCNVTLDPNLDKLVDTLEIFNMQGFSWYWSLNLT